VDAPRCPVLSSLGINHPDGARYGSSCGRRPALGKSGAPGCRASVRSSLTLRTQILLRALRSVIEPSDFRSEEMPDWSLIVGLRSARFAGARGQPYSMISALRSCSSALRLSCPGLQQFLGGSPPTRRRAGLATRGRSTAHRQEGHCLTHGDRGGQHGDERACRETAGTRPPLSGPRSPWGPPSPR
jgi:hypothetical protein